MKVFLLRAAGALGLGFESGYTVEYPYSSKSGLRGPSDRTLAAQAETSDRQFNAGADDETVIAA